MNNHEKYMREALLEAREALIAGEFPVGCVMVHEDEIVSRGRRINSRAPDENELDHAEIMALRKLFAQHPEIERSRIVVYSTMEPCLMCYVTLILNNIRTIVYAYEDVMGGGTSLDLEKLAPLYREMSVAVTPHVLRRESLELFKTFFANGDSTYWQDSPLARYTLEQIAAETSK
ncbi:MAG: cytidine deaminase [Desulfobacterales bacterium SG8_35_2]|jgi:tRNA(adenine34) deaminase|nr:MAG: cytidine deaminase [Desulfobacterales bacterium SG8_35_2]